MGVAQPWRSWPRAALVLVLAVLAVAVAGCADHDEPDAGQSPRPRGTSSAGQTPGRVAAPSPPARADAAPQRPTATPSAAPAARAPGPRGGAPFCGSSQDVEEIVVEQWASGGFRVSVRPTDASRGGRREETVAAIWQAIGACVQTGVTGSVADSLHAQLLCHQALAQVRGFGAGGGYATGGTYDLESWRPVMDPNRFSTWVSTRCANTLGTDPPGPPTRVYRPDGVAVTRTATGEHA